MGLRGNEANVGSVGTRKLREYKPLGMMMMRGRDGTTTSKVWTHAVDACL